MRLFEIVFIGSNIFLLLYLLFMSSRKIGLGAGLGTACAWIVHLLLEGYRWQLIPSYFAVVVMLTLVVMRIYRTPEKNRKPWKKRRYIGYSALVVLLGGSVFLAWAIPVLDLPKPGGQETVGTQVFHFTDSTRPESFTDDPNDYRELTVQVWYPAKSQQGKGEMVFPEDPKQYKKYMEELSGVFGLPAFMLDYWKYIRSNAHLNAELLPASQPYPLVLLSHGMGTGKVLHASQAENLASNGFIVAAIDHTYSTAATVFPNGRVTGFTTKTPDDDYFTYAKKIGDVWAADIQFVISEMEHLNTGREASQFKGMMDMYNIGIMGHSFGGGTAFNVMYSNDRITAGIDMDGTLYDLEGKGLMTKPFMFLNSDDRSRLPTAINNNEVPDRIREQLIDEQRMMNGAVAHGGENIHISGAGHYNFTDLQFYSPLLKYTGMSGDINGYRGAEIVNSYVLDFFNKHLKKKD